MATVKAIMNPKRRQSKEQKEMLGFVQKLEASEDGEAEHEHGVDIDISELGLPELPTPAQAEEEENVESDEDQDEDRPPPETAPPPAEDTWEAMSAPNPPSTMDFDAIMKNAAATRRNSYEKRSEGEKLVGNIHKVVGGDTSDSAYALPPAASKRGRLLRKFDLESPNYFGLKCWAERWVVVESNELKYYQSEAKEKEGLPPTSTHKLSSASGCKAEQGTGAGSPPQGSEDCPDFVPAVEGNGLDEDCFRVTTPEGVIVHRAKEGGSAEAAAWVRLFNESQALKAPSKKVMNKIRSSFTSQQSPEDLAALRKLAVEAGGAEEENDDEGDVGVGEPGSEDAPRPKSAAAVFGDIQAP